MNVVSVLPARQDVINAPPAAARGLRYWAVFLLTMAVCAAYLAYCLPRRGWVPHDDGALGQSAVRILHGELPHRDFAEVYTGGLAYLDAAAFRLFGANTMTTRWVMFVFAVPAFAALFLALTRFLSVLAAAAATVTALAWSFGVYSAAMPSWYNLIFAIVAVWAMLRFLESGNRMWLFAAGACAGCSFAIKLPGVYLLAALLLFLIFEEQSMPLPPGSAAKNRGYFVLLTIALLAALAVLLMTVHRVSGAAVIYHFFLPLAGVSVLVLTHEPQTGGVWERCRRLLRLWIPVLAGALVPVLPLLYVMRHALRQWLYGVFILPQERFYTTTTRVPPPLWVALAALPIIGVIAFAVFRRSRISTGAAVAFAGLMVIALLKAPDILALYEMGTYPIWMLATPVVLIGCATAWLRRNALPAADVSRTVLVLCVLAACALVQFPFTVIIYFAYIAPLVMLGVAAVIRLLPRPPHPVIAGALLGFIGLHALFLLGPTSITFQPTEYGPEWLKPLELQRAGPLLIPGIYRDDYQNAILFLEARASGGFTYCALDCPDVYFYSGLRNPTPILYDDFDNPVGREQRIFRALERHSVTAILLEPSRFLGAVPAEFEEEMARRYPNVKKFGQIEVRWR